MTWENSKVRFITLHWFIPSNSIDVKYCDASFFSLAENWHTWIEVSVKKKELTSTINCQNIQHSQTVSHSFSNNNRLITSELKSPQREHGILLGKKQFWVKLTLYLNLFCLALLQTKEVNLSSFPTAMAFLRPGYTPVISVMTTHFYFCTLWKRKSTNIVH